MTRTLLTFETMNSVSDTCFILWLDNFLIAQFKISAVRYRVPIVQRKHQEEIRTEVLRFFAVICSESMKKAEILAQNCVSRLEVLT